MCLMMSVFAYVCTVYIIGMSFSTVNNPYYCHCCGCPVCVCVCVCACTSVHSFLPPSVPRPRNIGTYMFTATRKTILYIIIVIFAENASFRSCGVICLPRIPLATPQPQKYGYQRSPRNVSITLLFAVLTKNDSSRSYSTFVYLLQYNYAYVHN